MSLKALIVGDVHATPQELEDCGRLKELVQKTTIDNKVDQLILLGDLYNTHSVVNTPVIDYWSSFFKPLRDPLQMWCMETVVIVGNHDAFSPTVVEPHALIIHQDRDAVRVVDRPMSSGSFGYMPYYSDPVAFLEDATKLKEAKPYINTLICHQTFNGAQLQEGFYAKDAVNPVAVPFDNIISGHIHMPTNFGKVWYPGSPRWRTLSDANQDRFINIVEFSDKGYKILQSVPTTGICKRIYRFTDTEQEPADISNIIEPADIRVDIYGSQDYISKRMLELKATYNARCRSFPTRVKKSYISEADGIMVSFSKFSRQFQPPKGTDPVELTKEAESRLSTC